MPKYKVLNKVEINGTTYEVGTVLSASAFAPASDVMVDVWEENPEWKKGSDLDMQIKTGEVPELSELESLLGTGHVEAV